MLTLADTWGAQLTYVLNSVLPTLTAARDAALYAQNGGTVVMMGTTWQTTAPFAYGAYVMATNGTRLNTNNNNENGIIAALSTRCADARQGSGIVIGGTPTMKGFYSDYSSYIRIAATSFLFPLNFYS